MKEKFSKPSLAEVRLDGPLTNDELAALPDGELAAYLRAHGYEEARRQALGEPAPGKREDNEQF